MATSSCPLSIVQEFAELLSYPRPDYHQRIAELERLLASGPGHGPLQTFQRKMASSNTAAVEELYTRAFDLAPQAVPYLGVYLFGAESPQRAQFMVGLSSAYAAVGFSAGEELPDHLAVIMRYASVAPAGEWEELQQWCLPAPVRHMRLGLEKANSPYQYLLASLESFLAGRLVGEPVHA